MAVDATAVDVESSRGPIGCRAEYTKFVYSEVNFVRRNPPDGFLLFDDPNGTTNVVDSLNPKPDARDQRHRISGTKV